jgi:hypothetical protein
MSYLVILTLYRNIDLLNSQLNHIYNQSLTPSFVIVYQINPSLNIEHLKEKYNFIHVLQDNTIKFEKFFKCLSYDVEYCIFMDDFIIPGLKCFQNYITQCRKLNSIIGAKGYRVNDKNSIFSNNENHLMDYVSGLVCIKKQHIPYVFSMISPCYDVNISEYIHLCVSNKIHNISTYSSIEINRSETFHLSQKPIQNFIMPFVKKNKIKEFEEYYIQEFNHNYI